MTSPQGGDESRPDEPRPDEPQGPHGADPDDGAWRPGDPATTTPLPHFDPPEPPATQWAAQDARPAPPAQVSASPDPNPDPVGAAPAAAWSGQEAPGAVTAPVARAPGQPQAAAIAAPPPSSPPAAAPSPAAAPPAVSPPVAPPAAAPPGASPPAGPPPARTRGRRGVPAGVVVLIALLALVLGLLGGVVGGQLLDDDPAADGGTGVPTSGPTDPSRPAGSVAGIAAATLPSTVSIEVRSADIGASGSGFVLREDGYILTNAHVIALAADGDAEVTVVFSDGTQETAEIVGSTSDYDLAVLHIDRDGLEPLPLGDSDQLVVGDPVVAVGAPLGLEGTVTSGIVSALDRPVTAGDEQQASYINAIQTDAAINPGNSGGPLLNSAGEVIGINSAIAQAPGAGETGSIGLGFAIPSNQARRTADELIENGYATYPVIGVLLDQRYTGEGVQVLEQADGDSVPVIQDGPADQAGIEPGDVIVAIDGRPVTEPDELVVAIRARAPGDVIVLTLRESGGDRDVEVTLGEERSN